VILVDTSVWIDHLRVDDKTLANLLDIGRVLAHPFVIGEVALGNLRRRDLVLHSLQRLPRAIVATDQEVLRFIDQHGLFGLGIGYVDAHLLAAVRLTAGASLWARDKRLFAAATQLGLAANLPN
jgi:predicted nucleic acid-binding protein